MRVEEVFGVSTKQVKSYIEREAVDNKFTEALKSDKQIIVYGASKQGKTALVKKYINYEDNVVISLSPKTTLKDIYKSILRKSDVILKTSYSEATNDEGKLKAKAKMQSTIALFFKASGEVGIEEKNSKTNTDNYQEIEFNLELPDDVADIIHSIGNKKVIILENFHYLDEQVQLDFAFDLRTFQDLKIRFIIVGVWKESHRLSQFNGELQDRIDEIPVEPWIKEDFERIIKKGEKELNIKFSEDVKKLCIENSFKSVGVFQELLRLTCLKSNIQNRQENFTVIDSISNFNSALKEKTLDYSERHLKNLEIIALGNNSQVNKDKPLPYFIYYYIVKEILNCGYECMRKTGMNKTQILTNLKTYHHRKDTLSSSNLTTGLKGLAELQSKKNINPPIIAYDSASQNLKVVDSTFYFFLKHANLELVLDEIINPIDNSSE